MASSPKETRAISASNRPMAGRSRSSACRVTYGRARSASAARSASSGGRQPYARGAGATGAAGAGAGAARGWGSDGGRDGGGRSVGSRRCRGRGGGGGRLGRGLRFGGRRRRFLRRDQAAGAEGSLAALRATVLAQRGDRRPAGAGADPDPRVARRARVLALPGPLVAGVERATELALPGGGRGGGQQVLEEADAAEDAAALVLVEVADVAVGDQAEFHDLPLHLQHLVRALAAEGEEDAVRRTGPQPLHGAGEEEPGALGRVGRVGHGDVVLPVELGGQRTAQIVLDGLDAGAEPGRRLLDVIEDLRRDVHDGHPLHDGPAEHVSHHGDGQGHQVVVTDQQQRTARQRPRREQREHPAHLRLGRAVRLVDRHVGGGTGLRERAQPRHRLVQHVGDDQLTAVAGAAGGVEDEVHAQPGDQIGAGIGQPRRTRLRDETPAAQLVAEGGHDRHGQARRTAQLLRGRRGEAAQGAQDGPHSGRTLLEPDGVRDVREHGIGGGAPRVPTRVGHNAAPGKLICGFRDHRVYGLVESRPVPHPARGNESGTRRNSPAQDVIA